MNKAGVSVSLAVMTKPVDPMSFRQIMGSFATGIAVVTARDPDLGRIGLTVNSLSSVSLDPPLLLFCIDKRVHIYGALKQVGSLTVNLLAAGQENISRHFASRDIPPPDGLWDEAETTAAILRGTLGYALCEPRAFYDGGDHTIFLCEVTAMKRHEAIEPLVYFQGGYRALKF